MKTGKRNKTNNTIINHNPNIGDTNMRTHNLFSRFGLAMVAILLLSSMQRVYAYGTLAGTVITNQASVQYNAGSNVRNATSNPVTMTVGYKVSLNLVNPTATTTTVDSTTIYEPFYAYNAGNYGDNIQFTVSHLPTGWIDTIFYDKNHNGILDAGDSAITSGGYHYTDTTYANRLSIILKITIPSVADNHSDSVTVGVQSYGSGPGGVVRVGGAGLQTFAAYVTIAKPVLSFTVTPTYGANKIPGETESYALTVTNTGHLATNGNSTVTWKYDNTNLTSVVATGGSASAGSATWTIGSLAGLGGTQTVNLTAVIEQISHNGTGVPYNTLITNGTTGSNVNYYDGVNHYNQNVASTSPFNVGPGVRCLCFTIDGESKWKSGRFRCLPVQGKESRQCCNDLHSRPGSIGWESGYGASLHGDVRCRRKSAFHDCLHQCRRLAFTLCLFNS